MVFLSSNVCVPEMSIFLDKIYVYGRCETSTMKITLCGLSVHKARLITDVYTSELSFVLCFREKVSLFWSGIDSRDRRLK